MEPLAGHPEPAGEGSVPRRTGDGSFAVLRMTVTPTLTTDQTSRPDKYDYATVSPDTWAVHGGNRPDKTTGAIRTPIVMANLVLARKQLVRCRTDT